MTRPIRHVHPLRSSDRPQPVDSWARDVTVVLYAIAVLLVLAGVATLFAKGYWA